jgi:GNAT superfamily N-acetyltransferase
LCAFNGPMTVELEPITLGDTGRLEARFDVLAAARAVDHPYDPPQSHVDAMAVLAHPWPGERCTHWLVRSGGAVAGATALFLPELDNLENASIELVIHPAYRRQGIGAAVMEQLVELARSEGRRRIIGELCSGGPDLPTGPRGNAAFAEGCGAKEALVEVRRRLDLSALDRGQLQRLLGTAEAKSGAYHLVPWVDRTPDSVIDGVATLETRMVEDAPMGDLAWEPEQFDAKRWRASEATMLGRERRSYGCASVHTETGEVTGFTLCVIDGDVPEHAWQWTTIVLPWHRGHRLGLRLKAYNLLALLEHEPALRAMDTWNAEENGPMIAVNDLMGFRPLDMWAEWQLELA